MKKFLSLVLVMALSVFTLFAAGSLDAYSAEMSVSGTVADGTSESMLKLKTSDGTMEIKLDSGTTYECKTLLPGAKVSAELTRGSDAYWHATKISGTNTISAVTLDYSNPQNVTGYIKGFDENGVMFFQTPQGEMQIKLDSNTDISEISILVLNKSYKLELVRGSDAYMHTTKIMNYTGSTTASSSSSSSSSAATYTKVDGVEDPSVTVTGKVGSSTTVDLLYLATDQGDMQIKLDTIQGKAVLVSEKKISITIGYGNDGYWHGYVVTNK